MRNWRRLEERTPCTNLTRDPNLDVGPQEGAMQHKLFGLQKYRQLAAECRYLAQITTNSSWKDRYLQLAKIYDTLAVQAEANGDWQ